MPGERPRNDVMAHGDEGILSGGGREPKPAGTEPSEAQQTDAAAGD
jgi:hypothetical protein